MFGLDWLVVVVIWSGVGNINFSNMSGLVWVLALFGYLVRS